MIRHAFGGAGPELRAFQKWADDEIGAIPSLQVNQQLERMGRNTNPDEVKRYISECIAGNSSHHLALGAPDGQKYTIDGSGQVSGISLDIHVNDIEIDYMKINTLNLYGGGRLCVVGAWIQNLTIHANYPRSIEIHDSHIRKLTMHSSSISDLIVQGGSIDNIICPPPTSELPFLGSVTFEGTLFPTRRTAYLLGAQPYRNMRVHLQRLENTPGVALFHALEQKVERSTETNWFNIIASHTYGALSDFGSSAARPFLIWIGLLAATVSFVYATDGADIDRDQDLAWWQDGLRGYGSSARFGRAFVLTLQTTVNPFGVFGSKMSIVPDSPAVLGWLVFHGIASTILLALLVFALRRRFKVSG